MENLAKYIKNFLKNQNFCVLATCADSRPLPSLMAYEFTKDFKYLLFATDHNTQKFLNIKKNPNVSAIFDNRPTKPNEILKSTAITATGKIKDIQNEELNTFKNLLINKHSFFEKFLNKETTEPICMEVEYYSVITEFEQTQILRIKNNE